MLYMILPTLVVVVAMIVFALTFKEAGGDEREVHHRLLASRFAFRLGLTVLSIGVVYQTLTHQLDAWLVGTLAAMTIGKIIGLTYGRYKH